MKDFNRQGFLGKEFEAFMKNDKVAIIGICGGGSHIVQQLSYMGFMNLIFIDFDFLEKSNLTRMVLATEEDVGELKVDIALNKSKKINPSNSNVAIPKMWQDATNELLNCKYIFTCLDSLEEREQIEMFCRRNNIIMIDIGMNVLESKQGDYSISGQVFVSRPKELCMKCFDFFNVKNRVGGEYGDAGPRPQVVFTNGILASLAVNTLMKFLSETYTGNPITYLVYDSSSDEVKRHPLLDHLNNSKCSHY